MNSNSEGHEFEHTHIVDWMNTENNVNEVEKVSTKFCSPAPPSCRKRTST